MVLQVVVHSICYVSKSKHNKVLENLSFVKQKFICSQIRWFTPGDYVLEAGLKGHISAVHEEKKHFNVTFVTKYLGLKMI